VNSGSRSDATGSCAGLTSTIQIDEVFDGMVVLLEAHSRRSRQRQDTQGELRLREPLE